MKSLYRQFALFLCLSLLGSMVKADDSGQSNFDFLKTPLENATMVENGLALAINAGGVSLSTLINTGLWWGVCKTPGIISGLVNKHQFTESEKKELESVKTDFCLQLAPLIAATETTLAGQVSPWPLEALWWRPVFWSGAALSAYGGYKWNGNLQNIPVAIMIFLTAEAFSRTVSSGISTSILKKTGVSNIDDAYYNVGEYTILAAVTGVVTSSIIYEAMLHKGVKPVKAGFISAVSAMVAGVLSGTISIASFRPKTLALEPPVT